MSILSGLKVLYQVIIQRVNSNDDILGSTPANLVLSLPDGIVGDNVYAVPDGAADQPLNLVTEGLASGQKYVDFVFLFSDQEVSFKLQGPSSTPIVIRAGGVALLDSKNITSMLLSNASGSTARVQFQQARWQPVP